MVSAVQPARIAVLGAGAMGSVFGGRLALAGHDVTLVDVRADHVAAVRRDGLLLEGGDGGPRRVRLAATTDAGGIGAVDVVIVLAKSFATEVAARSIAPAVGSGTWVVTLQNGLGNDRRLGAVLGAGCVVPGTTTVGAEQHAPGTARMSPSTAAGDTVTHLGPPRGAPAIPEPVRAIARLLTAAGLPAEALDDADRVIWTKLALAGPMGCLSALLRRSVIDTYEDPHARRILRGLFDEVVAVARAYGVPLDADVTWAHAELTFRAVGPHTASLAADVLAGRPTEVDALCLEVVRLGAERGVATPVSATVGRAIRALEATYDRALGG